MNIRFFLSYPVNYVNGTLCYGMTVTITLLYRVNGGVPLSVTFKIK